MGHRPQNERDSVNTVAPQEARTEKEISNLARLAETNVELRNEGVISQGEFRRNARLIGQRLVALMESQIEAR